jgi:hypothetical protein
LKCLCLLEGGRNGRFVGGSVLLISFFNMLDDYSVTHCGPGAPEVEMSKKSNQGSGSQPSLHVARRDRVECWHVGSTPWSIQTSVQLGPRLPHFLKGFNDLHCVLGLRSRVIGHCRLST